jgi:hypothetical protein
MGHLFSKVVWKAGAKGRRENMKSDYVRRRKEGMGKLFIIITYGTKEKSRIGGRRNWGWKDGEK